MKNMRHLIFSFCVLGLIGAVFFPALSASAHESDKHTITTTISDVSDDSTLEEFVRHAAAHLSEAATFSETLATLNAFRDESGDWNNDRTYLVLLTGNGGVYVHAKNRKLEDQDWSQLEDDAGKNVGQEFLKGGLVTYSAGSKAYAHPFRALAIPFSNIHAPQSSQFVLVGGFDYEPEVKTEKRSYEDVTEELVDSRVPLKPTRGSEARQVGSAEKENGDKKTEEERKQELKAFLEEAINLFTAAIMLPDIDPVTLRTVFRLDNGPWRYISTYIYIMDDKGNVIFNGANRNIEQTNLLEDPNVGEDIARLIAAAKMPGGGFVNYNWEDPAVTGDGEQHGGPGGDSPKLGYTKEYSSDKDDPSAPVYIFGSGIYLGPSEEDDGGCALSGTADSARGAFTGMLIVVSVMFSVVFIRRSRRAAS